MSEKHYCLYCMSPCAEGSACPKCGLTGETYKAEPHHLPPNTVLFDRYLVGRVLGEGGFGITYIGFDLKLELKVAIKEYFPIEIVGRNASESLNVHEYTSYASNFDEGKKKFLREARTMAKMAKQPEIVNVREYFEANNTAYIIMEFINGITYKALVEQQQGHLSTDEILRTFEPLFDALSNLHAAGLIHRDISPDNLMLENGKIRLLDFGCARETASSDATRTIMTKHGYAPLEQYGNGSQGPWTDVYALSATIYYCITGKKPPQALDRTIEDILVPPRKLGAKLTEAQEAGLLAGMAVRPNKRTRGIEELHTALYGEQSHKPKTALEPKNLFKPTRRNLFIALGCLVLCLAVGLTYILSRPTAPVATTAPLPTDTAPAEPTEPPTLRTVRPVNRQALMNALADDAVGEIVLDERFNWDLVGSYQINKPVRVEMNRLMLGSVTIGEGGSLTIAANSYIDWRGMLRTQNGGRMVVEPGSSVEVWGAPLLLLEQKTDVTGWERITLRDGATPFIFQGDEKPVYVTTLEELQSSLQYQDAYVVIDADIDAGDAELALVGSRVEIAQGASLTSSGAIDLQNNCLIVRGTLRCPRVSSYNDQSMLINLGTVEGDITTYCLTVQAGVMNGAVRAFRPLHVLADWEPSSLVTNEWVHNYATLRIVGDGHALNACEMYNYGLLDVQGTLYLNDGVQLKNEGTVTVSGTIENKASIIHEDGLVNILEGGHIRNTCGGYVSIPYGSYQAAGQDALTPAASFYEPWSIFSADYPPLRVSSYEELEQALADDAVEMICIEGNVTVEADLTLSKQVQVRGSLAVTGNLVVEQNFAVIGEGALTVGGELSIGNVTAELTGTVQADHLCTNHAFVQASSDSTRLTVRALTLVDSTFSALSHTPLLKADTVTLSGASILALRSPGSHFEGAYVTVGEGSQCYLISAQGDSTYPAHITVAPGGLLQATTPKGGAQNTTFAIEGTLELLADPHGKDGACYGTYQITEGSTLCLKDALDYAFTGECQISGEVTGNENATITLPEGTAVSGTIHVTRR